MGRNVLNDTSRSSWQTKYFFYNGQSTKAC
jgi:hypothetical protein